MIRLISTLFVFFLFIRSVYCQSSCPDYSAKDAEEIKRELGLFELELISNGYLKGTKPSYFIDFYKEYAPTGFETLRRQDRPYLEEHVTKLVLGQCQYKIESEEDQQILKAYSERIKNEFPPIEGDISPNKIATEISRLLKVQDLKKEVIKRSYLLSLYAIIWSEEMELTLLPLLEESENPQTEFSTKLMINEKDEFFVDNIKSDSSYLINYLIEKIETHGNELTIILEANRKTSYSAFIEGLDLINAAFKDRFNELSKTIYNKEFDDLSEAERAELKGSLKKNVTIKSPNN